MQLEDAIKSVELLGRELQELRRREQEREQIFGECVSRLVQSVRKEQEEMTVWLEQARGQEAQVQLMQENTRVRMFRGDQLLNQLINETLQAKIDLLDEMVLRGIAPQLENDVQMQLSEMRKDIRPDL